MEFDYPEPISPSSSSSDGFGSQEFENTLVESSDQDKHKECSDNTPTPTDQSSNNPTPKEGSVLEALLAQLCMPVSDILQDLLTIEGEAIDPSKHEDIEDIVEALLLLVTTLRTSTYNIICCPEHKTKLLNIFDWPESLLHKLIQYLVPRTTSEFKLDKLLMRLLEVILNPPKDLGPSKTWLFLAREIETKLVLEDAEVCQFLSRVFVVLPPQAKARISVSLLDYLKQIMYDDDTQDLVSNEMLNLVYIMSFDQKVQKSLISDDFQQKLLDWLLNSIDESTGLCDDSLTKRNNIITHILINLFQSCEGSNMKEFLTEMFTRAMSYYPGNLKLKGSSEIFSTLLTSTGFNSFVPVCIHFGNELGDRERSDRTKDIQNEDFLSGIRGLNGQHSQKIFNKIQSLQSDYKDLRLESFDFQLKKLDLRQENSIMDLQADGPKLLTFQYLLNEKLVTLGVYVGSSFDSMKNSYHKTTNLSTKISKENFFFCCLENEEVTIIEDGFYIDIELKDDLSWSDWSGNGSGYDYYLPRHSWKIQIHSNLNIMRRAYLVDYSSSEGLKVFHSTIAKYSNVYASYISDRQDTYTGIEPVKVSLGTPFVNFTKLQLNHGLYNNSTVATSMHQMFEVYRPGKRIIYVPKDLTFKEMLSVLFKGNESANTVQVCYQQNIVSHDTKIVDIDANIRDQGQFEIVDLTLSSWVENYIQKSMLSPYQVYINILDKYSSKLQKPLAKYLMNHNGGPLDFLKKVSVENINETSFKLMIIYQKIVEIVGPFIDLLSSIMKEDLIILLWHMLFSGCTSELILQKSIFTLILKNLAYSNLITSDVKQLYQFLSTAISSLLNDNEICKQYPGLDLEVRGILSTLMEAELLQNPKYVRKLVEAVLKRDWPLLQGFFILDEDENRNAIFCNKIENMLTNGMNLILTCCKDKKFSNNYLCMSQATLTFAKVKGYLSALEQDENFESDLLSLIAIFEDVSKSNGSIGEANNKMEYKLLEIMNCVYGKMAELIPHKADLTTEDYLVAVSDACCQIFTFVQNELEALDKTQDRFSSFDMIVEILNSVTTVLKKMIDVSAMSILGYDAANQFYYQYLSGMEAMGTSLTIARILGLTKLIEEENLCIGMIAPIFELVNLWSVHPVLSKLLDHEVEDGGMSLFKCCFEFAKELEVDLSKEDEKGGSESPLKKKNKELKVKVLMLLEKCKKTYWETK